MAIIRIFIGAMETILVSWFLDLLFIHLLLPVLIHKSESQEGKLFRANGLRHEKNLSKISVNDTIKMPFK